MTLAVSLHSRDVVTGLVCLQWMGGFQQYRGVGQAGPGQPSTGGPLQSRLPAFPKTAGRSFEAFLTTKNTTHVEIASHHPSGLDYRFR